MEGEIRYKVGEEALKTPLEELISAFLKERAKQPKDIKSVEKAAYKGPCIPKVFSYPIDLRPRYLSPLSKKASEGSIRAKYLNLSDIDIDRDFTKPEVIEIPRSYYDKILKELERLHDEYRKSYVDELLKELKKPYDKDRERSLESRRYPQYIEELVDELPYEDFVRLTYRSLKKHRMTPIDLTYDLLNEMARELYKSANVDPEEAESFQLNFSDLKHLGQQLRYLRTTHNISQKELSSCSSLARPLISYFENGTRLPNLRHILLYLEGLRRCISERSSTSLTYQRSKEY